MSRTFGNAELRLCNKVFRVSGDCLRQLIWRNLDGLLGQCRFRHYRRFNRPAQQRVELPRLN
jgi:hypothetical protein